MVYSVVSKGPGLDKRERKKDCKRVRERERERGRRRERVTE
jgi:hypothetical protein